MNTVCRLAWVCLLLGLSAAPGGAAAPAAPTPSPLTDADIRTLLRDWVDCDKLQVGLVVGLVDNTGTRVISYGKLGNGTAQEVDGDTLFCLGSVTKVFTALLLQDLVEQGKLRLEEPAQTYLPRFSPPARASLCSTPTLEARRRAKLSRAGV